MCVLDTGLSDQPKASESDLEPNEDVQHPPVEDSDTENVEDTNFGQYMPLSQNDEDDMIAGNQAATDDEDDYESEEDEEMEVECAVNSGKTDLAAVLACVTKSTCPVINGDTSKADRSTIDLDEKKIQLVKDVMLNIELPPENIPEWAKNIPEEELKNLEKTFFNKYYKKIGD